MGERWVRDCVVDLEHIDACWPRCHNRRPRRHRQRRRRRLQHLQVSTRIVQLGYGGNSGDVGGGEVDENVDRAQAEITGSRSRSLCRVLGSVSLRFGLFTLRPRWDPRGRPAGGSGAPGGPLFSRAPTAVHRGAARVRPERWSSPASLIDRSGPVIQHPVRSSRPAQTANPDHARRSTDVGHRRSGRCSIRLPAQIERDDLPEPGGRGGRGRGCCPSARRSTCQWAWERPTWRVSWRDGPTREALMSRAAAFGPLRAADPPRPRAVRSGITPLSLFLARRTCWSRARKRATAPRGAAA